MQETKTTPASILPLVSVIMPVYNSEKYVEGSIRSVLDQTYSNWELWIVDDCSTDNSVAILKRFLDSDKSIHFLQLEKNSGPATARNKGIENAKGNYIAFLDSDDLWKKEKLAIQVDFMQKNNYALSFSNYNVIDKDGNALNRTITCPVSVTYKKLLQENVIGCLTAMYDATVTGKIFMPDIRKRQDYGFWLNILKTGVTGHGIQTSLAFYRKYASSLSGNKFSALKYNWLLLRKYQHLNFFQASWYFGLFFINKTVHYISKRILKI